MLKKYLLIVLLSSLALNVAEAQRVTSSDVFNAASEAYKAFEFEQAATLFKTLDAPEAKLMAGKSYYALGRFSDASSMLLEAKINATPDIYYEAAYTLGLVYLNTREFSKAFDVLFEVKNNTPDQSLSEKADQLFNDFNKFLLPGQRIDAVRESKHVGVKEALLLYGVKHSSTEDGVFLIARASELGLSPQFISTLRRNQTYYIDNVSFTPAVPKGFTYNIGVLLPQQNRNEQVYNVSRELYFGLLMAVEQFNSDQDDIRVALHVAEADSGVTLEDLITELAETKNADVIFGPLFSQDAALVAQLSKKLNIPVLAPLANSEELTGISDWFFQTNPTFSVRGKRMAEVAYHKLGYRDVSIMNDRNSSGAIEARAFRHQMEEYGANIVHHFEIDFRMRRFDVADFTQHFAGHESLLQDTTITLQPVDAIFLPLTGTASNTMIDIVLTDLQVFRSRVSVIGTEDWGLNRLNQEAVGRFNIVYSGIFDRTMENGRARTFLNQYRSRFGHTPELFALNGYDNGMFILNAFREAGHPSYLADTFRNKNPFIGVAQQIHFKGTQVNQAVEPRLLTQTGHIVIQ